VNKRATHLALQTRKAWRIARAEGLGALRARALTFAAARIPPGPTVFPLGPGDFADPASIVQWKVPPPRPAGTPLSIGWVCSPPGLGSGGHTTMFRYISALEAQGHTCTLYLYDRQGGDIAPTEHIIRQWWPQVRAEVRDVRDGVRGQDAIVATSWPTAHVVARGSDWEGHRFYLVQDLEHLFYGRGAEYVLAEDTYRMGFHALTVGPMLATALRRDYGATATALEFGCDRDVYRVTNPARRRDVVFYAKPDVPRRGFGLGVLAMEMFHRTHPDVRIHTFGVRSPLPFPAVRHSLVSPEALADLYNTCAAGLVLSFTNVSLIPYELLACGVVPVVNDDPSVRPVLDHPDIRWARPEPDALATALSAAVDGLSSEPTDVAAGLGGLSWSGSEESLVRAIESVCRGDAG
jgi:glycosyltransferase involved in cell wall biosynthesis